MFICYILYMHIPTNSLAVLPWVVLFTTAVAPLSGKKFWTLIVHMCKTIVMLTYILILTNFFSLLQTMAYSSGIQSHNSIYHIGRSSFEINVYWSHHTLKCIFLIDLLLLLPSFLSGLQSHTQRYKTGMSPFDIYGLAWHHYFTYHVSYTIHVTTTNDGIGIIYRITWYRWSYGSIHISYSFQIHPNRNR